MSTKIYKTLVRILALKEYREAVHSIEVGFNSFFRWYCFYCFLPLLLRESDFIVFSVIYCVYFLFIWYWQGRVFFLARLDENTIQYSLENVRRSLCKKTLDAISLDQFLVR